jgi:uncharacterized membrane protein YgdD (TMEM256/DUF423 family)
MIAATRLWLLLAAVNGLMAVAAGAFGAHAASDPNAKEWLRTGAQYQLAHALAGLICFPLVRAGLGQGAVAAGLFGVGALIFAGSLYLMALTGLRVLGAVTPIGGLLLMLGWGALIWGVVAGAVVGGA